MRLVKVVDGERVDLECPSLIEWLRARALLDQLVFLYAINDAQKAKEIVTELKSLGVTFVSDAPDSEISSVA
jgi:hypothetical protein